MLSLILAKKIFSLFLIMIMSMSLVRLKIVKASDSKIMSILLLYLFFPCVIIESFQVDFTPEIQHGLLLSTIAAVIVQALLPLHQLYAVIFLQLRNLAAQGRLHNI